VAIAFKPAVQVSYVSGLNKKKKNKKIKKNHKKSQRPWEASRGFWRVPKPLALERLMTRRGG
jgi:hypothetical protein